MSIDSLVQKQLEMALAYGESLSRWALLIFGGTVAILVGTQHASPRTRLRWGYLLFAVAWACLGASLWYGAQVQSACVAYYCAAAHDAHPAMDAIRNDGRLQLIYLESALVVLGVWLTAYLVWWIWWLPKEVSSK
jgi:hypothetical protein